MSEMNPPPPSPLLFRIVTMIVIVVVVLSVRGYIFWRYTPMYGI